MAVPTIIGGNGYRWRGKAIRSITKDNISCVTMPRKDSMIMVPVTLKPGVQYKITVTACKNGGNGALILNFFGSKDFDGDQISVNITSAEMRDYTVAVPTPKFPNNLPMYLRVWRPDDSTGNVLVKLIQYSAIGQVPNIPREPKLPTITGHKNKVESIPRINKKPALPPVKPKENKDMKFKPYELTKSTSIVDKVLITKPEDVPKVSIITPTRDGLELLKKCHEAIVNNTSYPNWEWIVGDSLSEDGTEEYMKSIEDPRIKFVQRGTVDGSFSSINNELVAHATGEYLLFLNNDTEPQPFWLYEMMSKIHRRQDVGIVGAKLLYSENRVQHAGIAFIPQGPANLGKAVLASFPKGFADQDREFQAVTGACFLMRSSDFRAVGGFDPVYYFCYEDVDLCLKVKYNLQKKVVYAANAKVIHAESVTQKKHKTAGEKQQAGIKVFRERWMNKVVIDFPLFQRSGDRGLIPIDVSFVTCVNNLQQYRNYVIGSLFKNNTKKNYEIVPVFNFGNPYSASEALNIGIDRSKGKIIVLCHQDVVFYEDWVELLFERIQEIESLKYNWGVLGTAGITTKDDTVGVVHSIKGKLQWQPNKRLRFLEVQTVDEHCMIIKRGSGLKFDINIMNGFHFYGPDICLSSLEKGFKNFGILCPLVHDSKSGSLASGKKEFMRLLNALAKKWRSKFPVIRTPTSVIRRRSVRTFVRFKSP